MNLSHLRYAVEVERTGSITQAADNLYMGQPNLSKAIKDLETTLGITIFKRTSKGVVPTKSGLEFLAYAKSILSQIAEMESLCKREQLHRQSFSLSIPRASYAAHAFASFVSGLDSKREIEINYSETNAMQTIGNVLHGEFNLGIIRYQPTHQHYFEYLLGDRSLQSQPVWEFEYLALMSRRHPLADSEQIFCRDLGQYTEITHGDLAIPFLSVTDVKKSKPSDLSTRKIYVYERGGQFDLLRNVPSSYIWASPVPDDILNCHGLVQRRCIGANRKYKDVLIYPKGYKLTGLDKSFLCELNRIKEALSSVSYL